MSRTIGKEISPSALGELRARADADHLVHGRGQRDADAGHVADLRAPHAAGDHDVLGLDVALVGADPADPAVLDVEVGDLDVGYDGQRAGRQRPLAHDRAGAQRVDDADARRPEGADDLVGVEERHLLLDELGVTSSASMPQALAADIRRRSSSIRSSVRATSKPPDSVKTPISLYCSTESRVRSVISREWSTGKMKFDACPVDPPGLGSGPLSIWTMSRQPSSGQVVDEAVADDAGADDDAARGSGDVCHGAHSLVAYCAA